MKKKAFLALLLTVTMLLSGCALIKKDAAVDAKRVILSYNGKDVTKAEVQAQVDYERQQTAYMYSMYYGQNNYDTTDPQAIAAAQEAAVEDIKKDLVLEAKAEELKIADKLTEEDLANLSEEQISIARNEIFAKHGYSFSNDSLREYFSAQPWYTPNPDLNFETEDIYDKLGLSETEISNISFIEKYEEAHGLNASSR